MGASCRMAMWCVSRSTGWVPLSTQSNSVPIDHPIDKPVVDRLVGLEEAVALHVLVDTVERLAGVTGVDLVDPPPGVEDLAGVDLDVRRLALEAGGGLVDEHAGVGQGEPLALRAAG